MRLLYRVRFRRDHGWAPGRMSDYLDGELTAGGRSRMERHARDCPDCDRLLAGLRALVENLGHLSPPQGSIDGVRLAAAVRARLGEPPAS